MAVTNVLISGVGGQGTILASNVLADVALRSGLDVKQSEVHGMSQRGGNVVSMVRFGERVASPLVVQGEADILLAFEEMEALRYIAWLRPAGRALINRQTINPAPVNAGLAQYPAEIEKTLRAAHPGTLFIDATRIAIEMGNVRVANVILLGAMSLSLGFPLGTWDAALRGSVPPKAADLNLRAFRRGQEIAAAGAGLPA